MKEEFLIPVVLFVFKRKDTLVRIVDRIRSVAPKKVYILADGPRDAFEENDVFQTRKEVERLIDWECEIVKNYAECNRGVYANIALGAKWVLEREESAIFLEDDNLPEVTFFDFCREMLEKYQNDDRILWICGTNYLGRYTAKDHASYVFSKHMLPCGWATWSDKFNRFYDGELELFSDPMIQKKMKREYTNKKLYRQQLLEAHGELYRKSKGEKFCSWDHQMAVSIREHGLLGIVPCNNQIRNIGVDQYSVHGGTNLNEVMTSRFCELKTFPINFPLVHPKMVLLDDIFEKKIGNIILFPFSLRLKGEIIAMIKFIFGIPRYEHFTKENIHKFILTRRKWI